MLIEQKDIVRFEGRQDIVEVGGKKRLAGTQIAMHRPTGIVFIKQSFKEGDLYGFTVGKLDANGDVQDKVEFFDRTEKDFFAAVKHFEELIKKMQPEQQSDSTPPSMGKFYYFKKKTGKKCIVDMPGLPIVEIDEKDVDKAFTPPQSRPYGRLDMTIVDKPEYATIMSKFALKYDKEKADEVSKVENIALSDFAVYDMTPYSNNTDQQQQDDTPDDVNENDLSPDQIEGEDLNDQQNKQDAKDQKDKKQKEQQQKQDKKEKGDKSDKGEKGEKSDDKQKSDEKEEGDGEDGDSESDKGEKGEKSDKDQQSKQDQKSDGEQGDEGDSDEGEPGDSESESDSQSNGELKDGDRKSSGEDSGDKNQKPSDEDKSDEQSDETKISDDEGEEQEADDKNQKHVNKEGKSHKPKDEQKQHQQEKDDAIDKAERIPPSEFTDALRELYSGADLKDQFRRQKNLITAVDAFSEQELKQTIYKKLGVSQTLSKSDFLSLVESKTKNLFQ